VTDRDVSRTRLKIHDHEVTAQKSKLSGEMVDLDHYQSLCTRVAELDVLNRRLASALETKMDDMDNMLLGTLLLYVLRSFLYGLHQHTFLCSWPKYATPLCV